MARGDQERARQGVAAGSCPRQAEPVHPPGGERRPAEPPGDQVPSEGRRRSEGRGGLRGPDASDPERLERGPSLRHGARPFGGPRLRLFPRPHRVRRGQHLRSENHRGARAQLARGEARAAPIGGRMRRRGRLHRGHHVPGRLQGEVPEGAEGRLEGRRRGFRGRVARRGRGARRRVLLQGSDGRDDLPARRRRGGHQGGVREGAGRGHPGHAAGGEHAPGAFRAGEVVQDDRRRDPRGARLGRKVHSDHPGLRDRNGRERQGHLLGPDAARAGWPDALQLRSHGVRRAGGAHAEGPFHRRGRPDGGRSELAAGAHRQHPCPHLQPGGGRWSGTRRAAAPARLRHPGGVRPGDAGGRA